jgi:DNA-binding HxlR family transcriptional regulator
MFIKINFVIIAFWATFTLIFIELLLMNMNLQDSLTIFKALSDSSRLLIVSALREKPQYVEELAQRLSLSESTVSFHLKKLEAAQLVVKEKQQYYVMFQLQERLFESSLKELVSFANPQVEAQNRRFEEYRAKVLSTYFTNGVLLKLPSQYKKKIIILEEILKLFHSDRIYLEKEVDEIIKPVFADYVSIRRYLIDEQMMNRNAGKYRVTEQQTTAQIEQSAIPNEKKHHTNKKRSKYSEEKIITMANLKEINRALKEVLPPMGVYIIRDKEHNRIYLGSNKNLRAIFNRHRMELETHIHTIKELQEAYDKSGYEAISFEVIDMLDPKEEKDFNYTDDIQALEDLWCDKYHEDGIDFLILKSTALRK